jgi:hypothetical protein
MIKRTAAIEHVKFVAERLQGFYPNSPKLVFRLGRIGHIVQAVVQGNVLLLFGNPSQYRGSCQSPQTPIFTRTLSYFGFEQIRKVLWIIKP